MLFKQFKETVGKYSVLENTYYIIIYYCAEVLYHHPLCLKPEL